VLNRACELGVNFIDTTLAADDEHSEQIAGRGEKRWWAAHSHCNDAGFNGRVRWAICLGAFSQALPG